MGEMIDMKLYMWTKEVPYEGTYYLVVVAESLDDAMGKIRNEYSNIFEYIDALEYGVHDLDDGAPIVLSNLGFAKRVQE
jgi:negative regulator of genetic competence, sporulation and motility